MSHIKGSRTSIENEIAHELWRSGIHYRRNYKKLPGKPDIAITKYKILVFCDGDFWHGYHWHIKKQHLKRNRKYWIGKIETNMARDKRQTKWLRQHGWTVLRFWGHTIKKHPIYVLETIKFYIRGKQDKA